MTKPERKMLTKRQNWALVGLVAILLPLLMFAPIGCAYLKMRQIQDQIGAEQDAKRNAPPPVKNRRTSGELAPEAGLP